MISCLISNNLAINEGGGIINEGKLILEKCNISNNAAGDAEKVFSGGYFGTLNLTIDKQTYIGNNSHEQNCDKGKYRLPSMTCAL